MDRGNTSQEEFLALTNKRVTVAQANGRFSQVLTVL